MGGGFSRSIALRGTITQTNARKHTQKQPTKNTSPQEKESKHFQHVVKKKTFEHPKTQTNTIYRTNKLNEVMKKHMNTHL